MSILQDLDPKYAKLHKHSAPPWKYALWLAVPLSLIASGYWMMTKSASTSGNTDLPTNGSIETPSIAKDSTLTGNQQTNAMPSPPLGESNYGAIINEGGNNASPPTGSSTKNAVSLADSERSLADTEYGRSSSPLDQAARSKAKLTSEKPVHKTPTSASTPKKEAKPDAPVKKANERDVDIITAIVR